MDEEVWPPAPQGVVDRPKTHPTPRPALWLQVGIGLAAGALFVPLVWMCLRLLSRSDTVTAAQFFDGVSFLLALAVSALAWRYYRAFAVTFAVVSAVAASLNWFLCAMAAIWQ